MADAALAHHPFLEHEGPIAFAHRGGLERHAENTMAAFAWAIELGYRYLETDVHATADGVLIAFHDDRLDRVTDRHGAIRELAWSEVRAARLGGTEPVVRLDELLGTWPDVRFNLEPKDDASAAALSTALEEARAVERVCIGSFADHRLKLVRDALGARVCTSLGPSEIAALRFGAWGVARIRSRILRGGGRCLQVPLRRRGLPLVDRRTLALAHELGLPVHIWTINDRDAMHALLDLGVDGLMTDRPTVLKAVLEARGAWRPRVGSRP